MNLFDTMYCILHTLEQYAQVREYDPRSLTAGVIGVSKEMLDSAMYMLSKEGYIEGVDEISVLGRTTPALVYKFPRITLAGLDYLENDSNMVKARNRARGV